MAFLLNETGKTKSGAVGGLDVRGFTVWGSDTVDVSTVLDPGPVWFVFNGMGRQWVGMGRDMLNIPTFNASIRRSATTLQDLVNFDLICLLDRKSVV